MIGIDVLIPIVAVVAFTLFLLTKFPSRVENGYNKFNAYKSIFTTGLLALIAITFLQSGDALLFLVALLLFVLITIYIYVERPEKELV